jgi:hypothetical protein
LVLAGLIRSSFPYKIKPYPKKRENRGIMGLFLVIKREKARKNMKNSALFRATNGTRFRIRLPRFWVVSPESAFYRCSIRGYLSIS